MSGVARPLVGIVLGSESDAATLGAAAETLRAFEVPFEMRVRSAHRMPEQMVAYAKSAAGRGLRVLIAGAGGAAHLPGMLSALTALPVLGVPVRSRALAGVDSLLSIVQMPAGVPTATFAIGEAGATNAALFAVRMLAQSDDALLARLERFHAEQCAKGEAADARVAASSGAFS